MASFHCWTKVFLKSDTILSFRSRIPLSPHPQSFPTSGVGHSSPCASGITTNLQDLLNKHLLSDNYVPGTVLGP